MSKDQENDLAALSATIADRLHRGDDRVLEEILDRFGVFVRGKLASRFGTILDELDLDDVLSRALFRLWRYRDRYDPQRSSLATWFYLLGRSAALDLLRERAGQQETDLAAAQRLAMEPARPEVDQAPAAVSGSRVLLARLRELLQELPELDRRILLAFAEVEGQGNWAAALASQLGMAAATVRSRKLRALARLREQLGAGGPAIRLGEPSMSTPSSELHGSQLHADRADEIEFIAAGLHRYFMQAREPFLKGDGLAHFQAAWTAAVKDGSIKESSRLNILTQTYRWLRGRASEQEQYRNQLREFFERSLKQADVPIHATPEEGVRRLELALAGISTEIERPMPDDAIRTGEGRVYLRWEKDRGDATITWEGGNSAVRLRGAVIHSFAAYGRLADPAVAFFSDRVMEEVAQYHRLALPNFAYPSGLKPGQLPETLDWRPAQVEPAPERQLPGWIKNLQAAPDALPTPAEQDFHSSVPEVAERLDKMLCEAALEDYRMLENRSTVRSTEEPPARAVAQLIDEIARRAGRTREEVGELAGQVLLARQGRAAAKECAANSSALAFIWSQLNTP